MNIKKKQRAKTVYFASIVIQYFTYIILYHSCATGGKILIFKEYPIQGSLRISNSQIFHWIGIFYFGIAIWVPSLSDTPSMKLINSNHGQPKNWRQQIVLSWLVIFPSKESKLCSALSTRFGSKRCWGNPPIWVNLSSRSNKSNTIDWGEISSNIPCSRKKNIL